MHLVRTIGLLKKRWPGIRFSQVYQSTPTDLPDQPDFLNAVATFQTDQAPHEVAEALQDIERTLGKTPVTRFGPRTIDLDFLLYDNLILPSASDWLALSKLKAQSLSSLIPACICAGLYWNHCVS